VIVGLSAKSEHIPAVGHQAFVTNAEGTLGLATSNSTRPISLKVHHPGTLRWMSYAQCPAAEVTPDADPSL